jgi:hypothetical protein
VLKQRLGENERSHAATLDPVLQARNLGKFGRKKEQIFSVFCQVTHLDMAIICVTN